MEEIDAIFLKKVGGDWLKITRQWIQRRARNGSTVIWGSDDLIDHILTVKELEDLAADIATHAINEYVRKERHK